jgi:4-hydroxy-tetrahydrodipicolinate synthase
VGRNLAGLQIRGVIAALLLPRDEHDQPRWDAFDRNARFLVSAGIDGLCVNGATGEYTGATAAERSEAMLRARRISGKGGLVLCGIGGSRLSEVLLLARDAEQAGADGVLVPAPHFFKYAPEDLAEFYRRIAAESRLPVLIYNLPAFTGGLDAKLAAQLIREVDGIAGVKDSSGELELLSLLSHPTPNGGLRLVGNDGVLAEALEHGLCDGTVSGVAGVLPELTLALWRRAADGEWDRFHDLSARQDALLRRLDDFPAPWGLKLVAELRGLAPASPAIPLSEGRRRQAEQFEAWFREWWTSAADALEGSPALSLAAA